MSLNMNAIFKIVAQVDGEGALNQLGKALGGVQENFSGIEGAARKARTAFGNVVSSAAWQGAAVVATGILGTLAMSARTAIDFEKAMTGVAAKTGATGDQFNQLNALAQDLGRRTIFSASEAASAMDFLAMAGFDVNEILAATPSILTLATAGSMDLGRAADIVSNILGPMGMKAEDTGRLVDVLAMSALSANTTVDQMGEAFKFVAPVLGVFGSSIEEGAAAMGILGNAGIQASEAGTGLRTVLLRLADPPTEAAKALERLGVSTMDANGNMRPFGDILADVDKAMKDLNLGTGEQLAIQNALYGKTGITAGAMLQAAAASGEFAQRVDDLNNSQGFAAEVAEKMGDNVAGAFARLRSAWEGFQIALVGGAGGPLQLLVDGLANVVNAATDLMVKFPMATTVVMLLAGALSALVLLAPGIAATLSLLSSIGPVFAAIGATIAGGGFAAVIAGWAGAIMPAVAVVTTALGGILTWATTVLLPGLLAVFSGPVGWTVLAVAAVVAMALFFREPLMGFLTWLWEWGTPIREFWVGLWESVRMAAALGWQGVTLVVSEAIAAITLLAQGIGAGFLLLWDGITLKATEVWAFLTQGFMLMWAGITAPLLPLIEMFRITWDAIKEYMGLFFAWAGETFYLLYIQPIQLALNALAGIFAVAWEAVKGTAMAAWLVIQTAWATAALWFQTRVTAPIQAAWALLVQQVTLVAATLSAALTGAWVAVTTAFMTYVIQPIQMAWTMLSAWFSEQISFIGQLLMQAWANVGMAFQQGVVVPIQTAWQAVIVFLQSTVEQIQFIFASAWNGVVAGAQAAFGGLVQLVTNVMNTIISMINRIISGVNAVRSAVPGLTPLSQIPPMGVPAFAAGGVVSKPTLAMVGEGGEREYIIPESKMARASQNYLAGQRGGGVLGGGGHPAININTGPVMQQNGQNYATVEDLEMVAREVASQIYSTLRTPGGRRAMGIA